MYLNETVDACSGTDLLGFHGIISGDVKTSDTFSHHLFRSHDGGSMVMSNGRVKQHLGLDQSH